VRTVGAPARDDASRLEKIMENPGSVEDPEHYGTPNLPSSSNLPR
jgi:hypothetical protein